MEFKVAQVVVLSMFTSLRVEHKKTRKSRYKFSITPLIASFGIKVSRVISFLNNQLVYTMSDNKKDQ